MRRLLALCIIILLMSAAIPCGAEIPQTINYQGTLTQTDGVTPVPDSNYTIIFNIYDVSMGGFPIWADTFTSVPVTNGLFNVVLGSSAALDLPFDQQYWLEIQVGPDLPLSPRIELTSVGYAYRALVADSAINFATQMSSDLDERYVNVLGQDSISACSDRVLRILNYGYGRGSYALDIINSGAGWNPFLHDYGIHISVPRPDHGIGMRIYSPGFRGIEILETGQDALWLYDVGNDGIHMFDVENNGIYMANVAGYGVQITNVGKHGFAVNNAGWSGVYVASADSCGFKADTVGEHGLSVTRAEEHGIYIKEAGKMGVCVESTGTGYSGINIAYAGGSGVHVDSALYWGVYAKGRYGSELSSSDPSYYGLTVCSHERSSTNKGLYVYGTFTATGTKSSVIPTSSGYESLFAIESPDVEFMASGSASLVNGEAQITFERLFREAISVEIPIKVIITPTSECNGIYVSSKSSTGFRVKELLGGKNNATLDWLAIGRRKGYEKRSLVELPEGTFMTK